jgi:MFS family permease
VPSTKSSQSAIMSKPGRMSAIIPFPSALRALTTDAWLLFVTRLIRLFAYGSLSVILVFYLVSLGFTESQTGLVLTLTLAGDIVISLYLTNRADRVGRRRILVLGAILMAAAGLAFAFTHNLVFLIIAGTIGVISPSGKEVGPFLSIEQASLSHLISPSVRTEVFAWYTMSGSIATALGALFAGAVTQALQHSSMAPGASYRAIVLLYAFLGLLLALLFARVSGAIEVNDARSQTPGLRANKLFGLGRSRSIVLKLSGLFALDAFGGGFVIQSFAAYWFYLRFGADPKTLGGIFFWANVFAGISALLASRLAKHIGLVRTMVFTHLPSNLLLILVPLMPTLRLAVLVLLLRFSISQMDVPTRQSYTMAVVEPEERSAAGGFTAIARTSGATISPIFAGFLFARPTLINFPFYIAGTLKVMYDLLLFVSFQKHRPPEEREK